jgi:hypothetical protein
MLHIGTLEDLLHVDADGKRQILNALDIKMGGAPMATPPQYR